MSKQANRNFIISDNFTKTITLNFQEISFIQILCENDLDIVNHTLYLPNCPNDKDYLEKKKFLNESIISKIKDTSFDK